MSISSRGRIMDGISGDVLPGPNPISFLCWSGLQIWIGSDFCWWKPLFRTLGSVRKERWFRTMPNVLAMRTDKDFFGKISKSLSGITFEVTRKWGIFDLLSRVRARPLVAAVIQSVSRLALAVFRWMCFLYVCFSQPKVKQIVSFSSSYSYCGWGWITQEQRTWFSGPIWSLFRKL